MKLFIFLIALFITFSASSQTFEIKYKGRQRVYDDQKLTKWGFAFSLDFILSEDSTVVIPARMKEVTVMLFDDDSYPERGKGSFMLDPNKTIYNVAYDQEVLVYITENDGPNTGKQALWKFFFTYTKRPKR